LRESVKGGGITSIGDIATSNKREQAEWAAKRSLFGM
jgi:hypothetical protein